MGSGAVTYVPSFIKIDSDIQKLIGGMHSQTDSIMISWAQFIFQNQESRLKMNLFWFVFLFFMLFFHYSLPLFLQH
jgi:hypothetical protein